MAFVYGLCGLVGWGNLCVRARGDDESCHDSWTGLAIEVRNLICSCRLSMLAAPPPPACLPCACLCEPACVPVPVWCQAGLRRQDYDSGDVDYEGEGQYTVMGDQRLVADFDEYRAVSVTLMSTVW